MKSTSKANNLTTASNVSEDSIFVDAVWQTEDGFVTSSVMVAKIFEKDHKHVLDAIRDKISTAENSALGDDGYLYKETTYIADNAVGNFRKPMPMYLLNQNSFSEVALAFTGEKAFKYRRLYINQFEKMRKEKFAQIDYFSPEFVTGALKAIQHYQIENSQLQLENSELHQTNDNLREDIKKNAPKVAICEELMETTDLYEVEYLSKRFGLSPHFLRKYLQEKKIIFKCRDYWDVYSKNTPYFKMKLTTFKVEGETRTRPKVLITPAGIEMITKMLIKDGYISGTGQLFDDEKPSSTEAM